MCARGSKRLLRIHRKQSAEQERDGTLIGTRISILRDGITPEPALQQGHP